MKTISLYADSSIPSNIIHARLDKIAYRIPCFATFRNGEITISCRVEDAIWVEDMISDLV